MYITIIDKYILSLLLFSCSFSLLLFILLHQLINIIFRLALKRGSSQFQRLGFLNLPATDSNLNSSSVLFYLLVQQDTSIIQSLISSPLDVLYIYPIQPFIQSFLFIHPNAICPGLYISAFHNILKNMKNKSV